jgi:hypothetical protein
MRPGVYQFVMQGKLVQRLQGLLGFDAIVGSDQEAAVLLTICIGELVSALERLVGTAELERQIDAWWDDRRIRLTC